jgi:hypothetical protein
MKTLINKMQNLFTNKIDKQKVLQELYVELMCCEIDLIDDDIQNFGVTVNHRGKTIDFYWSVYVSVKKTSFHSFIDPEHEPSVNIQINDFDLAIFNRWGDELEHDFTNDEIMSVLKNIEIIN